MSIDVTAKEANASVDLTLEDDSTSSSTKWRDLGTIPGVPVVCQEEIYEPPDLLSPKELRVVVAPGDGEGYFNEDDFRAIRHHLFSHVLQAVKTVYSNPLLLVGPRISLDQESSSRQTEKFKFRSCTLTPPGVIVIDCANKESFQWFLKSRPPNLHKNMFLIPFVLTEIPLKVNLALRTSEIDASLVLALVRGQNKHLSMDQWVLSGIQYHKGGFSFTFLLGPQHMVTLEKAKWTIFFELHTIIVNAWANGTQLQTGATAIF